MIRLLRRAGASVGGIARLVVESALRREARGVHRLLEMHAGLRPGAAAVVDGEGAGRRVDFATLARRVRSVGPGATSLEELSIGPPLRLPPDVVEASDRSAILYTSGTTGVPKGARPDVPDLARVAEVLIGLFRLGAGETILVPAPLHH